MGRPSKLPLVIAALESPNGKRNGLTRRDLEKATGISRACVDDNINRLYSQGEVHVSGWKKSKEGGPFQARYKLGAGQDVPKPRAMTSTETSRRWRAKQKKIPGGIAEYRAQHAENERRRYWRNKAVKPDPLAVAFFGLIASNDSRKAA